MKVQLLAILLVGNMHFNLGCSAIRGFMLGLHIGTGSNYTDVGYISLGWVQFIF